MSINFNPKKKKVFATFGSTILPRLPTSLCFNTF